MSSVPKERRGLGRGLEVLLGEAGQPELVHLPVETIHPNPRQPRRRFEPEAVRHRRLRTADAIGDVAERELELVDERRIRPRLLDGRELLARNVLDETEQE